jgi:hypothetical protein
VHRPLVGLTFFAALACASEPKLVPIIGPDGSPMFHASCSGQESRCYELAGQQCPSGYDVGRTFGERGNFLIRCRHAGYAGTSPSWAPALDLAPTPYGAPPTMSSPYSSAVPLTTAPPGYPPLGTGNPPTTKPSNNDVGY